MIKTMKKFKRGICGVFLILLLPAVVCIAAYRTHTEIDSGMFFAAYPNIAGTRMDGCDACHISIVAPPPGEKGDFPVKLSSCDSCHIITDYGRKPGETINAYGKDYLGAGRNELAFKAISESDSDGDGWSNAKELEAATNPGDPSSNPGMKLAPHKVITFDELKEKQTPVYDQTIFVNVSKSKDGDSYSDLRGFMLYDVLKYAGISEKASSVDVISIDGYAATFSVEQLKRSYPQAVPVFGFDKETFGECGWVRYGSKNLKEGVPLPNANVLLTFEINGEEYEPAKINEQGRLSGAGPFRVVAPQMKNPGLPDNSSKATEECAKTTPETYRYNRGYEKNADYCVKSTIAIRVNPLPEGSMDIDWPGFAKKAIANKEIVVFGALGE